MVGKHELSTINMYPMKKFLILLHPYLPMPETVQIPSKITKMDNHTESTILEGTVI